GIGNTSAASALVAALTGWPVEQCVGRGTGLDDEGLARKCRVIAEALANRGVGADPWQVLATFGGFEIAMMVGAFLAGAEAGAVLLIDGFIVSAALLVASRIEPAVLDYCVFAHASNEAGHARLLDHLQADPLLM